jgi:hypothetical protein
MNIIIRDVFKSGRCCGQLYDPADIKEDQEHGEEDMRLNLRVIRRSADLYEVLPVKDPVGLHFEGRWTFTSKVFREFDGMIRGWLKKRFEFGVYRSFWSGGPHTSSYYYPPGRKTARAGLSKADEDIRREINRRRIADGFTERAVFSNGRQHAIALAFDWQGLNLYWTRNRIALVRNRALTEKDETGIARHGMAYYPYDAKRRANISLTFGDALYISEVARLAAIK